MSDLILVVDDNKPSRDVLARRLLREGYEVLAAENGATALQHIAQESVSLVLLDLDMPDMTGLQVLDSVRERYSLTELPVLMVSATTDSPQMAEAIDRGANDFITKPVPYEVMLAKVRQKLKMRSRELSPPPPSGVLSPDWQPTEGSMVAQYRLLEKLGKGGAGHVFRALDTRLLREVALKVVVGLEGQDSQERFLQEGRAVARVDHPGVVLIHEIRLTPCRFIVMELIQGKTLKEYAAGGISVEEACYLTVKILETMEAVHAKGVIHRDLKPANIMITDTGRIKIMDFGLAHTGEQEAPGLDGGVCGTPVYMSPEHFSSEFGVVDAQSDLFSVAVIFYELLTNYLPFNGSSVQELLQSIARDRPDPPRRLRPEIPVALQNVCLRGLSKKKEGRYPDATSFAAAVRISPWV